MLFAGRGQRAGSIAAYSASLSLASALMSNSRSPSFLVPDSVACSRKISAGPFQPNALPWPSREATWAIAHQSARASPGTAMKAR